MPWGALGAAVGGIGSAIASNEAADDASDAAAASTAANTQLARETLNYQSQLGLPGYRSDAARRAIQDRMVGLPGGVISQNYRDAMRVGTFNGGGGGGMSGGRGSQFSPEALDAYLRYNPDVAAEAAQEGISPREYAEYHWTTYGMGNGTTNPNELPGIYGTEFARAPGAGVSGDGLDTSFIDDFDAQKFLESTPGYQFRRDEGLKARERSAAAKGSLYSGATLKGLDRYAQDYASGEYWDLYGRLGGGGGAGNLSSAADNYANRVTTANNQFAGAERESAYGRADAWGDGLGALAGAFGAYRQDTKTPGWKW